MDEFSRLPHYRLCGSLCSFTLCIHMSQLVAVSLLGYNQWGQDSWKGVAALLVEQLLRLGIKRETHLSIFGGSWKLEEGDEGSNSVSGLNSILGLLSQRGTFFFSCVMPGTLCQKRRSLQPKAVSDQLVSLNGFAVRLSWEDTVLKDGRRNRATTLSWGDMVSLWTRLALIVQQQQSKETLITSTVLGVIPGVP